MPSYLSVLVLSAVAVYHTVNSATCPMDRACLFQQGDDATCDKMITGSICAAIDNANNVPPGLGGCCTMCAQNSLRRCILLPGDTTCTDNVGAGSTCVPDIADNAGFGCCSPASPSPVPPVYPTTTTCNDKINPLTGVSDCPSKAYLCNDSTYYEVMTEQCPKTCGRCNGPNPQGSCIDQINPQTGVSDCPQRQYLCTNPVYQPLMRVQCPATCGFCIGK